MRNKLKIDELEYLCRKRHGRLTWQRHAVLESLASRRDHPTADQVYADVRTAVPGISKTTVYRVLDTLVELGLASRVSHPRAVVRFDAETKRHDHILCVQCGALADLEAAALELSQFEGSTVGGFEVTDYSVYFRGVCPACRRERDGCRSIE
jgi:Fur family peroxide stress response transcriptional regulator